MAEPVCRGQLKKLWEDTIGVCYFAIQPFPGTWDLAIQALGCAVGWPDYSHVEALTVGERLGMDGFGGGNSAT